MAYEKQISQLHDRYQHQYVRQGGVMNLQKRINGSSSKMAAGMSNEPFLFASCGKTIEFLDVSFGECLESIDSAREILCYTAGSHRLGQDDRPLHH